MNLAFAYAEGELSGPWFRAYKAVKRRLRRGGLGVSVQLLPLTELQDQVDVLVLPDSLSDTLSTRIPASIVVGEIVVARAGRAQKDLDALVERLLSAEDLRVGQPARTFAVHQGFRPLGQRGRVED